MNIEYSDYRLGYAIAPGTPFLTQALTFPPAEHAALSNLRLASAALQTLGYDPLVEPYTPARYPLYFKSTSEEQTTIHERLQHEGITAETPLVVIHAGTGGAVKLWRTEAWARIANRLRRGVPLGGQRLALSGPRPWMYVETLHEGDPRVRPYEKPIPESILPAPARIVLTGSPKERSMLTEIAQLIELPPLLMTDLTVGQLAALLARAQLVLGVDNGPLHMAAAQDTPSIRLYGPTDAHIFGPWADPTRHIIIASTQKCAACPFIPCGRLDFSTDELDAHPCVRVITEEEVERDIKQLVGYPSFI